MNIKTRSKNILIEKINSFLSKFKNPVKEIERNISKLRRTLMEISREKRNTLELLASSKRELILSNESISRYERDAQIALDYDQENAAKHFISRKIETQNIAASIESNINLLERGILVLDEKIKDSENNLKALYREKNALLYNKERLRAARTY